MTDGCPAAHSVAHSPSSQRNAGPTRREHEGPGAQELEHGAVPDAHAPAGDDADLRPPGPALLESEALAPDGFCTSGVSHYSVSAVRSIFEESDVFLILARTFMVSLG